ncbi:MAG: ATPase, T2SS/T4P/T4SS family [Candidatus Micrarchaeota archaeon]
MEEIGWKVDSSARTAYFIAENFDLSHEEQKLYSALINELKENAQKDAKSSNNSAGQCHELLKRICDRKHMMLRMDRARVLEKIACMNIAGFGVFDLLLADDSLEEIAATGLNRSIRVYSRGKGWLESNCTVTSKEFAANTINKMARALGRRITYRSPLLNAQLPDGSRLHATVSPVNGNEFEITIRKFSKSPLCILDLVKNRTINADGAAFLWLAAFADISILIAGNTGSGKTTLLNALFSFVPLDERIIVAEETPEISILHKHRVNLVSNEPLGISMADLVQNSLRMRPDRVIIGEVRTPGEVSALFESLRAGQAKGSFATFHAQNSREVVSRLGGFGINPQDLGAVDIIVVLRRISIYDPKRKQKAEIRRVTEISEISESGKPNILFEYNAGPDALEMDENALGKSKILGKIGGNYKMDRNELLNELEKRKKMLERMDFGGNNADYAKFTELIQNEMFGWK